MTLCNKGVVQADPLPPSCGQRPHFYIFFGPFPYMIFIFCTDPPPQFRLKHFLYDFLIFDLPPPLQTRLSHSLYDFFYIVHIPPIPHTHYLPNLYTLVSLVWP